MAKKLSFRFVLACLLAACARDGTSGQTTGRIAGVVKDQSGGFVPAAEITAVAQATGACRTATTNEAGGFAIPVLPPRLYYVSGAANGFPPPVFSPAPSISHQDPH